MGRCRQLGDVACKVSQTKPNPIQAHFSHLLKSTDLFSQVSDENLEHIAEACKIVNFAEQTRIVSQGDTSDELYIIGEGRVAVIHEEPEIGSEQLVTTLGPQSAFGEASLLTGAPRSATIKALEETICVQLSRSAFESVLKQLPEVLLQVCRYLAARLHHQCQLTGFRFVSLQDLVYEPDLYGMFPSRLVRRLKAVPFKVEEDTLTVALVNPYRASIVKELREAAPGYSIEAVVCTLEDYEAFLRRNCPPTNDVDVPVLGLGDVSAQLCLPGGRALEPPLSTLLREALNREASYLLIHGERILTPLERELETFVELPDSDAYESLSQQLQDSFFSTSEGPEIAASVLSLEPNFCRVELSRVPTTNGPRFSVHLAQTGAELPTISELFPNKIIREKVLEELQIRGKIVLFSGPPLSGLTSTAFAVLAALKKDHELHNMLTIETEPYSSALDLPQVPMGSNFVASLKACLMQAPKLLMVDELSSGQVPDLVRHIDEGLSSLLCLRSTTPIQEISDLCRDGALDHNGLSSLGFVLSQDLLPRLCPHCRVSYKPTSSVRNQLVKFGIADEEDRYFKSDGCEKCYGSGTVGRVLVTEGLIVTEVIREFLLAGRTAEAVSKLAQGNGLLIPFSTSVSLLLRQGDLSPAVALRFFCAR
jgi:Tfp pilus assembly pilus retraction ATPase PilT